MKLLRPLRLFDMKELALYNKFNDLEPPSIPSSEVNPYSSVQDLMRKFVNDLQQNFPATITTIMKTGDKLSLDKRNADICSLCKVGYFIFSTFLIHLIKEAIFLFRFIQQCTRHFFNIKHFQGTLPQKSPDLTSEESTSFSHVISTKTVDYSHSREERYQDILENYESHKVSEGDYCYACSKLKSCIIKTENT